MKRVVMKFGGSSVATTEKIRNVADVILKRKKEYDQVVVVVSAMGKTTDGLISMAEELSENPSSREMDLLMSTGEMVSASLLSIYFNSIGHDSVALTGFQCGVSTVGSHRKSKVSSISPDRIESALEDGKIVVVTGFQGINESGDITTLGRGGSDTSAVALAAVLNARCEIYTDVMGIYTVDPRIRSTAKKIDFLTYEETMEMANLGAKVIEPRSVEMAERYSVPLYIALNTGDILGTTISGDDTLETNIITNISKKDDVLLVTINERKDESTRITECFKNLADRDVNIDLISHALDKEGNQISSFTTDLSSREMVKEILGEMGIDFSFKENLSKVSVIGNAMRNQVGVAARAFGVLFDKDIKFYEVSTSEISISYIIDSNNGVLLVNALADEFGL